VPAKANSPKQRNLTIARIWALVLQKQGKKQTGRPDSQAKQQTHFSLFSRSFPETQTLPLSRGCGVVTIWNRPSSHTLFPTALGYALEALPTPPTEDFPFSSTLYFQLPKTSPSWRRAHPAPQSLLFWHCYAWLSSHTVLLFQICCFLRTGGTEVSAGLASSWTQILR